MAQFVLKFKLDKKPNRGRDDITLSRSRITMGSRPLADIYVPDRLLPQEACDFVFDGSRLTLDVRTSLPGVFVDGAPVTGSGPVSAGAAIQIGETLVEVAIDDAKQICTLTVGERYLPKTIDGIAAKAPTKFSLSSTGPQEHRWGKSNVITQWNWIAVFLGLVTLAAFPFLKDTEVTNRGPLHSSHALGTGDRQPKDCASCHSPLSSEYGALCGRCHFSGDADKPILLDDERFHPYGKAKDFSCQHCHPEHRGADGNLLPPTDVVEGGWQRTCVSCHADQQLAERAASALADPEIEKKVRDQAAAPVARTLFVDGFSHKDHRVRKTGRPSLTGGAAPPVGESPVACSKCHLQRTSDAPGAAPDAEFAMVSYETCLDCHADWRVDLHGRDQDGKHCFQCHAKTDDVANIKSAIRRVDVAASGSLYELVPRGHDYAKDDCVKCHLGGKSGVSDAKPRTMAFQHDHHLPTVTPESGDAISLHKLCAGCHKGVEASSALSGLGDQLPIAETTDCTSCHDSVPKRVPGTGTRTIVDMFHAVHTVEYEKSASTRRRAAGVDTLAGGCLSCHVPVAGAKPMGLRKDVEDCTACHKGHESLGSGKCALCHVDRTSPLNYNSEGTLIAYRTNEPGIFNREKAISKSVRPVTRFDHFSDGHKKDAGAPDGTGCVVCHNTEQVDNTTRILDVAWPGHADPSCVKCHVQERFHR